jgi:hypothetical protein
VIYDAGPTRYYQVTVIHNIAYIGLEASGNYIESLQYRNADTAIFADTAIIADTAIFLRSNFHLVHSDPLIPTESFPLVTALAAKAFCLATPSTSNSLPKESIQVMNVLL